MPISSKEISDIRNSINSSLKPLLPLANVAPPQAMAIQFGIDLLLRGIILGFQIKEARQLAQEEREKITGARGIPYWSIPVATKRQDIRRFFVHHSALHKLYYPLLFDQLQKEIQVFSTDEPIDKAPKAFRVLLVAHDVVTAVYDSKKFGDAALQEVFGKYLSANSPQYGDLAREYASLRGGDLDQELTKEKYAQILSSVYWQTRRAAGDIIDSAEVATIDEQLQEKIQQLWMNFAFGSEGLVTTTTKFVVEFSKEELKREKQKYEAEVATLQQSNAPDKETRIAALKKKIAKIDAKLQEIAAAQS